MAVPPTIFVDFNRRLDWPGEVYRISLLDIDGLNIGDRVLGTDYEIGPIELELVAIHHADRWAAVAVPAPIEPETMFGPVSLSWPPEEPTRASRPIGRHTITEGDIAWVAECGAPHWLLARLRVAMRQQRWQRLRAKVRRGRGTDG